jgi:drug/metabolite transporter (DMT)-like permease
MHHDPAWKLKAAAAFATVYLVWGSTYLAIRVGVASLPPALFAGARFLVAGLLLTLYARFAGQRLPRSRREWKIIVIVALLLLAGANGLVVWGEQWVTSNQAALIAATTALWLAGLGALGPHGQKLSARTGLGLATGFAGVALLLAPDGALVADDLRGQLAIVAATLCWAGGSIYAKRRRPATPPLMSAGLQSLVAGTVLGAVGVGAGEAARWTWDTEVLLALAYLIVFGSCLAYAAYVWLLHEVSPAALGTYAYINPAIAVVLGWWLLDEILSAPEILSMGVILLGVVLVSSSHQKAVTTPTQRV